jgi:hypothetical protein
MKSGAWLPSDNRPPAAEHTGWHAIAALVLLLVLVFSASCGDEDFVVGGPLPSRPSVAATNPSATPDDNF